jgi:protein AroM
MTDSAKRLFGLVTIGQSPRDDIMPQIWPFLPSGLAVRQVGALDGLTRDQIADLAPPLSPPRLRPEAQPEGLGGMKGGDYVLHTRMRDGTVVTVGRAGIMPLLQACLEKLEGEGANPILLLCTGELPELRSNALLIEPDRLLVNLVRGLRPQRVGVLVPLPSQIEAAAEKWRAIEAEAVFEAASPYGDEADIMRAARALPGQALDLVVMDCMGYTGIHKQVVVKATGRPVVLASQMVARIVGELVDQGRKQPVSINGDG